MKSQQIKTADGKPNYAVTITNNEPKIAEDRDTGVKKTVTGAPSVPSFVDLPAPAQAAMSKPVRYAVTESGEFIAYNPEESDLNGNGVSLRAHLAKYDPETDEFVVLEFVK